MDEKFYERKCMRTSLPHLSCPNPQLNH
jgi:hypothetical protein